MSLAIHPNTKVGDVLDAYPAVEEKLIAFVPAFAKLRNPILRKTVARVATLEAAARMASIPARELVMFLREQTGQGEGLEDGSTSSLPAVSDSSRPHETEVPAWVTGGRAAVTLDADAMLAAGEHPLGAIHTQLAALEPECYLRLLSSFLPAPLFDAMRSAGVAVYWRQTGAAMYETYLARDIAEGASKS
ncbi:MAG: DUF1858 domain-containing protein [Bryobacterales bacterium]|jgi:hypothetical protein|nr:DUF1858 domain-containing protein [Bryobacterales bacterium]